MPCALSSMRPPSTRLDRWDGRGTLTAQEVMDRTASAFQGRFAEVVTIEQVLTS